MVTYFASATATSAKTAYFQFRQSTIVTASASATATSTLSQADADQIAKQTSQQIADSTVENEVNLMVQTVDVTTVGDTIFGLDSSILSDYVNQNGNNSYILTKSFNVPNGLRFAIKAGQSLTVPKGVALSSGYSNDANIVNNGTINLEGGVMVVSKKGVLGNSLVQPFIGSNSLPTINRGTIYIYPDSYLIIEAGETFDNGTDNYSTTSQIQMYGGILLNYGICNNYGIINGIENDMSNNILNGVSRTVNNTSYVPTMNVNFNNYGLIQNTLGILNGEPSGDPSNNGITSYFTNETTSTDTFININGAIVNNSIFYNKLVKSTIICSGFSNLSTFENYGWFQTPNFGNISSSMLYCDATFTNYNNFHCTSSFNVFQLSNYGSYVFNKSNHDTSGNMIVTNMNSTNLTFYGVLENDSGCSFICTTNGFINSNTITNNGTMTFGTANPPVTSLTNNSYGTITNNGTIYCGSFVNNGTFTGTQPSIL